MRPPPPPRRRRGRRARRRRPRAEDVRSSRSSAQEPGPSPAPAVEAMLLPPQLLVLAAAVFSVVTPGHAQQRFLNTATATKYAAINLIPQQQQGKQAFLDGVGLSIEIGQGQTSERPLMVQSKIWEPRCDNGYPNVIHDPADRNGAFRLWYGCFSSGTKFSTSQGSARTNAWMYANSSDGLTWLKPNLGVYDLSNGPEAHNRALPASTIAALKAVGKNNNIVMGSSDGMGITRDEHERNSSRIFKAFGTGMFGGHGGSGVSSSPDGIHFDPSDFHAIKFSKKPTCVPPACPAGVQRYDDHQQVGQQHHLYSCHHYSCHSASSWSAV
jgi:hypothetical protein